MQRRESHTQPPPPTRPRPQCQQDDQRRRNQQHPQERQKRSTTSPLSPISMTSTEPPSPTTENYTYSSLMRDKCVYEVEPGFEDIRIDEDWIARNGAFACIWALTYKLGHSTVSEPAKVSTKHKAGG